MATSTIKFYKNDLLRIDRNFMYSENKESSNFETFLNNSLKKTIENFQYIKHGLDISIKVKQAQSDLYNKATTDLPYNYVSIKNSDDNRIYYYYIVSGTWRSSNCIQYELSMDTIATFWNEIQSSMSDKSTVVREHRDRFVKPTSPQTKTLIRKIDPISEGIQVANKQKKKDTTILDKKQGFSTIEKWYLIYRTEVDANKLDDNPIKCYLCADSRFTLNNNIVDRTIETASLNKNFVYFIPYGQEDYGNEDGNTGITFTTGSTTQTILTSETNTCIQIFYNIETGFWTARYLANTGHEVDQGLPSTYTLLDGVSTGYYMRASDYELFKGNYKLLQQVGFFDYSVEIDYSEHQVQSITSLDRTDSRLNSIIELPYCPTDGITYNSGKYYIDPTIWKYDISSGFIKLIALDSELLRTVDSYHEISNMTYTLKDSDALITSSRNDEMESKVYHSDFNQIKIVYDSYSVLIDRERIISTSDISPNFKIKYKQSNNLNNSLLFDVSPGVSTSYKQIADNENIIISNRNNESPIYQSAYLNYMRNGYNYDKKAQDIQNNQQTWNMVSQIAQSAISLGLGISDIGSKISSIKNFKQSRIDEIGQKYGIHKQGGKQLVENDLFGIREQFMPGELDSLRSEVRARTGQLFGTSTQLMLQNTSGIIGSIVGAVTSKQLQENSMNQKFAELQAQSASTVGSNDLNLLNYYNGNKLHEIEYQVSDNIKESIYDLFYYLGYTTNLQKKPDLYSRKLFNYIEVNADFNNSDIFNNYLEDIKIRLAGGLTVWHNKDINKYGYNNPESWIN